MLDVNLNGVWRCARNVGSMYAMNVNRPRWQSAYLAS